MHQPRSILPAHSSSCPRPLRMLVVAVFALALAPALGGCDARIGDPTGDPNATPDAAPVVVDAPVVFDAPPQIVDAAPEPPDAAPVLGGCELLYGAAPGYLLCRQEATTCEFNVLTNGGNCDQMCSNFGGTCLAAYDNDTGNGEECVRKEASGDDCTTTRNSEICVCSRF